MADATDFILSIADRSGRAHERFEKEQTELETAQNAFNSQAAASVEEAILDLTELQGINAQQAVAKSEALDEMSNAVARLNELNNMPGIVDAAIAPVAALFDPNFDRNKLISQVKNSQAKLGIADARADIKKKEIQLRQEERALGLKRLANTQMAEGQDVENLQARINAARSRAADHSSFKAMFLQTASVDEMRDAVNTGFISEKDMKRALRSERAQELALQASEFQGALRELNQMPTDELEKMAAGKDSRAPLARDELVRRQNRDVNALAVQRAKLEYDMQSATEVELQQMVKDGTINEYQFEVENDRRATRAMALEQTRLATQAANRDAFEQGRAMLLRTTDNATLDRWEEAAEETGQIDVGGGITYTIDEIQEVRDKRIAASTARAVTSVQRNSAQAGLVNTAGRAARASGLPAETTDPWAVYETLAADPGASPGVRQAAATAAAMKRTVDAAEVHPRAEGELMRVADEAVAAAVQAETAAKAALKPKSQQAAYVEWVNEGAVTSEANALSSAGTAVAVGQRTGNDYWDVAIEATQSMVAQMRDSDPRLATTTIGESPETILAPVMLDPESRSRILQAFYDEATVDVYKSVAAATKDDQLIAMLGNPESQIFTAGGVLDDVAMLEFLDSRPEGAPQPRSQEFLAKARVEAREFANTQLPPSGTHGGIQAALDRLLFQNNVSSTFVANFDRQMFMNLKAKRANTAVRAERAERAAEALAPFAP